MISHHAVRWSGIAAALSRSRGHLLTLAIDMPFMTQWYLRSLCEKVERGCWRCSVH